MTAVRALLVGGGTAGHTSPLLATADALQRLCPDVEILCVGTPRGIETHIIPEAGLALELIPPVPLPRRPSADLLRVPDRLVTAVRRSGAIIRRFDPHVIVGFGGYVALPVYLAARRTPVPLVIHEGNALPGLANRVGARVCTRHVATSFPGSRLPHAVLTGLPIRRSISQLDRSARRAEACASYGLDADLPTLLVTGGSQGAAHINTAVAGAAAALGAAGVQVLHVAGRAQAGLDGFEPPTAGPAYRVVPFVDRMELAYAAADAQIGRAGSNTVTEAAVLSLPSVFVPLPIGNGEQKLNAEAVVAAGGALLVADADLSSDWVAATLPALLTDRTRLTAMAAAAHGLVPADADEVLARLTLRVAGA
jgi:UDP-N-acetylglucosamine--N-acetylmuramyl-(pentapeptide) pyrophosphoryl-undecaprenol N-acetylglucosamine transferase